MYVKYSFPPDILKLKSETADFENFWHIRNLKYFGSRESRMRPKLKAHRLRITDSKKLVINNPYS